jgi:FtsP/CotA-like multicopper oxidase with cupredoxin domain
MVKGVSRNISRLDYTKGRTMKKSATAPSRQSLAATVKDTHKEQFTIKIKKMKHSVFLILNLTITLAFAQQNELLIPPTLQGSDINLTLQHGSTQFFSGQITATMGVNGNILGPTIILENGQDITLNVINQLGEPTTIHWHGLHVAPENDGGPHTVINNNSTWSPSITVLDRASTFWYHPHLHHKTNEHVSKGIAGFIIVKDNAESQINLPRTYSVDDIPLAVQTKDFDLNNQIVFESNSDDVPMVNATINPYKNVPAQVIRLRLLNGSSQRAFNFGFTNNHTFYQIGSDGGLLNTPVELTRLLLSPGERAEILINLTGMTGQTVNLMSYASELPNGIYGATNPGMGVGMTLNGYNPNPLNGSNFNLLQLNIGNQTSNPVTTIPTSLLPTNPWNENDAAITRNLTFSPAQPGPNQLNGHFLINEETFNMDVINFQIPLNNIEIWQLTNQSAIAHPFHIHDVQFNILTRNGVQPPLNERGWKDVVLVRPGETVRFITKFETFYNKDIPYMYHCHLLTHEDDGMMGQFIVFNTLSTNENYLNDESIIVYPNPSQGTVNIKMTDLPRSISIFNTLGQKLFELNSISEKNIQLSDLPKGVNFIKLNFSNHSLTREIIIE